MRNHKFGNDPLSSLVGEVGSLSKRVIRLKNRRVTTASVSADSTFFTGDAVEGQLAIDTTGASPSPKFYQNGQWWEIAGGYKAVNNGFAHLSKSQLIPRKQSGSTTYIDFTTGTEFDPNNLVQPFSPPFAFIYIPQAGFYILNLSISPDPFFADTITSYTVFVQSITDAQNDQIAQGPMMAHRTFGGGLAGRPSHIRLMPRFSRGDQIQFNIYQDSTSGSVTFQADLWLQKIDVAP